MRLNLNEFKSKIHIIKYFVTFSFACLVLCGLSLTVSAETKTQWPLPYGFGSGYGYREWSGSNPVTPVLQYLDSQNITYYGLLMYEQASDNSYVEFIVPLQQFYYISRNNNGAMSTYPSTYLLNSSYGGLISVMRVKITQNGTITTTSSYNLNQPICPFPVNINGTATVASNTFYLYYPVYTPDYADITIYQDNNSSRPFTGFVFGGEIPVDPITGSSIGGQGSGHFIPASGSDSGSFDFDINLVYDNTEIISGFTRMDDQFEGLKIQLNAWQLLWEAWKTGQQTVLNGLQNGINTIIDKLTDIQGGINQVVGVPSSGTVASIAQDSDVMGGFIEVTSNANGLVTGIFEDFGSNDIPTSADMDFDYPFHWSVYKNGSFEDKTTSVHISFGWYESIRSKVLLVIGVFMVVGFVVYIIKQIPNFINGVGGASTQIVNRKGGK